MSKKRRKYSKKKQTGKIKYSQSGKMAELVFLLSLIILVVHLWGRVQIDTVIRKKTEIEVKKSELLHEIDDLRVKVNIMKSYKQVVARAKGMGMTIVPPHKKDKLFVDIDGVFLTPVHEKYQLNYAGLGITGF